MLLNNFTIKNEEKIRNLQTYDLILLIGQSYLSNDGSQNFFIFKPAGLTDTIAEWKSKGLSNEKIKPTITVNRVSLQNGDGWII